ncbi:MAG: NAD+ synthase [Actinomycetota bacterium]|nr:NAD+ synthase [Actinomycetota bacterium]
MIRIALAQMNLTVGDIDGNVERMQATVERADSAGAQVVALPELAITGYPPEDLLLKSSFVDANLEGVEKIARSTADILAIVGFVDSDDACLYNAAAICHSGKIVGVYRKHLLPNYGVFDEDRYFEPGVEHLLIETGSGIVGVCICEDAWTDPGPVITQGDAGAQVVVNINASPFHEAKGVQRARMLSERARRADASIVYVNMIGGQDELVFDGGSLVISPEGHVLSRSPQFEERLEVVDVPLGSSRVVHGRIQKITVRLRHAEGAPPGATVQRELSREQEIYDALTLGLADYVRKNRFRDVIVGLSGGIDSSLTAVIAADAVGPDHVLGLSMPSPFSSAHSIADAVALAANLGIDLKEIPIGDIYDSYLNALNDGFGSAELGIAEENLQARIRGNLLMAASNRYGHLVLATGNKSEMACGYSTLYGDMAGGFALLKDVFKTEVYALARYRNSIGHVIPDGVLTKAPSAELRPGQQDDDSLPPYDVLDPILEAYIEGDAGIKDIVAMGHDAGTVEAVVALVDRAEYKRRQAPPGPKVTTKAFGRDRRLPITNRWREGGPFELPARSVGEEPSG